MGTPCGPVLPQGFRDSPHLSGQAISKESQNSQLEGGTTLQHVDILLICFPTEEMAIPQNCHLELIKVLHNSVSLGQDALWTVISRIFQGKGLSQVAEQIASPRPAHIPAPVSTNLNESNQHSPQMPPRRDTDTSSHACRHLPRVDRRIPDMDWKGNWAVSKLLHASIPWSGLIWSDNGLSAVATIAQSVAKGRGIKYQLHYVWKPLSSGKEERASHYL